MHTAWISLFLLFSGQSGMATDNGPPSSWPGDAEPMAPLPSTALTLPFDDTSPSFPSPTSAPTREPTRGVPVIPAQNESYSSSAVSSPPVGEQPATSGAAQALGQKSIPETAGSSSPPDLPKITPAAAVTTQSIAIVDAATPDPNQSHAAAASPQAGTLDSILAGLGATPDQAATARASLARKTENRQAVPHRESGHSSARASTSHKPRALKKPAPRKERSSGDTIASANPSGSPSPSTPDPHVPAKTVTSAANEQPAFLATVTFTSTSAALDFPARSAVGNALAALNADGRNHAIGILSPFPESDLSRNRIRAIQDRLTELGYGGAASDGDLIVTQAPGGTNPGTIILVALPPGR